VLDLIELHAIPVFNQIGPRQRFPARIIDRGLERELPEDGGKHESMHAPRAVNSHPIDKMPRSERKYKAWRLAWP